MALLRTVKAWVFVAYFLLLASGLTRADSNNSSTDWFRDARYGIFMHFLPGDARQLALTDQFDVEALARQLEEMGAKYFVLTLQQNSGYCVSPNRAYSRITKYCPGERASERDLPLDLYKALHPRGIRLMLYLPCQPPNRDAHAQRAFGLPEGAADQPLTEEVAQKWAEVIQEWSDRYGDKVAGWWFDGGYEWVRFNESIAQTYARAVKHGNPNAIVSFNPGVRVIRHTQAEDYTAGELNEPFGQIPASRWLDGSQWHALTFLGANWSDRGTRYPAEKWAEWVKAVTAREGVVTLDMGPNWDPAKGPIGSLAAEQVAQVKAIRAALNPTTAATSTANTQSPDSKEWISLFDGKSLDGWKASESQNSFKVVEGMIQAHGERSHLFYVGGANRKADFKNFEFSTEVLTRPGTNSGIYFHTEFQEKDWPGQGFEVQIDNSQKEHNGYLEMKKTGSLYGVRNVYKELVRDNEWFTVRIAVRGPRVQIHLNDTLVVDYVEPPASGADSGRRLSHGAFALQGHDPESEVSFRNLRVKPLPDDLTEPAQAEPLDDVAREILRLGRDNFPLVDFHTHLKGGITLDKVLEHMRRTGINHGIAVNGGIGFPITNDAGIEEFRKSLQGNPCYIALQAEGREWTTLFSAEAIAKFDYVFTDAMTIPDHRGKRTRLWIKEEVEIPEKQAFMDLLVKNIVSILDNEPIDIYVNPTFLPDMIAAEYDALWTPERMQQVVDAAARNGVAIEINSRLKIPNAAFIRLAKKAGVKFTLGTNNTDKELELGRLEYSLQMVKECGLTWKDMWMPKPDGQKPIQVKAKFNKGAPKSISATSANTSVLTETPKRLKRADSFLGVHFDFHAGKDCNEIGKNTTREMIESVIDQVHPDYLQIDCKGHPGLSSYPTNAGNRAPGFVGDPLRLWRQVTAERGVSLYMHYSGVWDSEAISQHPDWAAVNADGKANGNATSFFGPYADKLLIPQLRELSGEYKVDGAWVDGECWASVADYSEAALQAFKKITGIQNVPRNPGEPNWYEFLQFNREAFRNYLCHYITEVKKTNPEMQLCSNWAFTDHMPEAVCAPVDFISGDYSPEDSVNSARFSARYMARQGKPWDLMAWSFARSGGQKSAVQLQREAAVVLALGGGFQAYFTQRRDGSIKLDQIPVMAEVAKFCRARQAICHRAMPVPQVAVLYSTAAHYRESNGLFPRDLTQIRGTLQALLESQQSVEVLGEHHLKGRMAEYPLIVVPECGYLELEFKQELLAYVQGGGHLLLVGPQTAALFQAELGIQLEGNPQSETRYLAWGDALTPTKGQTQAVKLDAKAKAVGQIHAANDPQSPAQPAASVTTLGQGQIAAIYFAFSQGYIENRSDKTRGFLNELARQLFPKPLVEVKGSSDVDVSVNRMGGRLAVNLVNTAGPHVEKPLFDSIPPVGPLEITIQTEKKPEKVTLEPGAQAQSFEYRDGALHLILPKLEIHSVVVVE